ncbi:hypothetical protein EMCRGX_G031304 [Ephydatia muelleri]
MIMERQYTLLFAGKHGVGKTKIFSYLKRQLLITDEEVLNSVSSNGHRFVTTVESHDVVAKVSVQDTAGMELSGTLGMTRSYFKDSHGIILVANSNVVSSLHVLSDWVTAAQNYSDHGHRLVISLWLVDYEPTEMSVVQDFLREWHIPYNLMVHVSIANGNGVMEGFTMMVDAVIARNDGSPSSSSSLCVSGNTPVQPVKGSPCCS